MSAMFTKLKTYKRRQSEAFLQRIGQSERTEDEIFDAYSGHFAEIVQQINELEAQAAAHVGAWEQWVQSSAALGSLCARHFAPLGPLEEKQDAESEARVARVARMFNESQRRTHAEYVHAFACARVCALFVVACARALACVRAVCAGLTSPGCGTHAVQRPRTPFCVAFL